MKKNSHLLHQMLVENYSFPCLYCNHDLTVAAEGAVYDWSEGLPNEVEAWCEKCDKATRFKLAWEHVLYSVRLVMEESEQQ